MTLLLSLGTFLLVAEARAQEAAPTPDAPAPEEPPTITMANFGTEASAVEERLAAIETALVATGVSDEVGQALEEIEAKRATLQEQFGNLRTRRMTNSEINALQNELGLLDARTKRQIDKLGGRAKGLQKLETQNEIDIEVWTQAVRDGRDPSVPQPVRERTVSILKGLRQARQGLEDKLGALLLLQSRTLEVLDGIERAQRAVNEAQRKQAQSVFARQDPPLFGKALPKEAREDEREGARREGYQVTFSWPAVKAYLQGVRGASILHLLFVLLAGWIFVRTRAELQRRFEKRQQQGRIPWEDRAIEAMHHPWAAALLVGIASVRLFYPERVIDLILLTWVVLLPVWYVVYKEMVPGAFRKPLVGLGLLGTLEVVLVLISGRPGLERGLLLLELVLAGALAVWTLRLLRNADLPKRVREGLWFFLSGAWTRVALLTSGVGVVAVVLGYTYLGEEAAGVSVIGTIVAGAMMSLARIFDAVLATAIHAGRLDAFRMIRANRDVTTKTLGRIIRIAAGAWFLWIMADMTSAWRPFADLLDQVLHSDLGFGFKETGVTLLDVLGFFFILWLSWVLARLVGFVLQEELFPRLHMEQGVPYALTTFTRYAIIAVGFIAAMAVLGIPLDRVTIILSALGVGIGFGLQNVVNNVVSGFILLTERPIRLRDKVEIEGVLGNVSSIGIRASRIRTFDGAEVIVPNGDLISERVVNWTFSLRQQRVTIPVGVAYGTDPNEVLTILRRVAAENDRVFKDPAPLALFRGFGDSALNFELRIFMDPSDVLDVPSAVSVAIAAALKEADIAIPFPQRDVHVRSLPEGVGGTGGHTGASADTGAGTGTGTGADTGTGAGADNGTGAGTGTGTGTGADTGTGTGTGTDTDTDTDTDAGADTDTDTDAGAEDSRR